METKSIDQYFKQARNIPVALSFKEVQALVKIKGITKHRQSWWKTKNFIFMTTAAILFTTTVLFFVSLKETEQISEIQKEQNKNIDREYLKEKPYVQDNSDNETAQEVIEKPYLKSLNKTKLLLTEKKEISLIIKNVSILSKPIDMGTLLIGIEPTLLPLFPLNNLLFEDTVSKKKRKDSDTKLISKEVSAEAIDLLEIFNYKGDISIETWDKQTVKMDAYISITVGSKEDVQKALEDFDLDLVAKGRKLEIENDWSKQHDCKFSETTIKGKLMTKKGEKIKVKKYSIDYVLTVPNKINLIIKDSYGDIIIKNTLGDVKATSFQGDFTAGNIKGEFDLNIKYGAAKVESFAGGEVTLFHSKSNFGSSKKIELDSKYSDVNIAKVGELEIKAFQTNIKIEKDVKKIGGNLKYGDLSIGGKVNVIDLEVFQAKIEMEDVNEFDVEGSYSNFKAKSIKNMYTVNSFQNSYRIGSVGTITGDSKYTSFDIGVLKTELDLKTFQGNIDIDEVLGVFRKLDINSKYTSIDLTFSADAKFNINAETMYTDFIYPENSMQVDQDVKENHKMTFKGVFNAKNKKEPSMVNVISLQGRLSLSQ
tara:strand:- start:4652 stop:6430 length:1779 start_codon:yes stop_codon:yes gene_type:complete